MTKLDIKTLLGTIQYTILPTYDMTVNTYKILNEYVKKANILQ